MEDVEEFHENKRTKGSGEEKIRRPVIKTPTDLQRLKLEKLMKNPVSRQPTMHPQQATDKPIVIPDLPKEKDFMLTVPNFVRNVMGSSAGAGSGEFHVYRHLRRKEYARQKHIQAKSLREQLDDQYREKLEKNRLEAEAKTAKKRAKRLKKKQKLKERGGKKAKIQNNDVEPEEESAGEDDDNSDSDANSDDEEKTDDHKNDTSKGTTDEKQTEKENNSGDEKQIENNSDDEKQAENNPGDEKQTKINPEDENSIPTAKEPNTTPET